LKNKTMNSSEIIAGSETTIFNVAGAGRAVSQPAKEYRIHILPRERVCGTV
jgi:hypothetical protein